MDQKSPLGTRQENMESWGSAYYAVCDNRSEGRHQATCRGLHLWTHQPDSDHDLIRNRCTVKSKWIAIVAVDINRASSISGSKYPLRRRIVVYEGHHYAGVSILIFHMLHIFPIGERDALDCIGIFVFRLQENDGSAIRDLHLCNNTSNILDVIGGGIQIVFGRGPKFAFNPLEPPWKPPSRDLCVDIGAGASKQIYPCFTCSIKEWFKGENSLGGKVPWFPFYKRPVRVEADTAVSKSFDFLEDIKPKPWHGQSEGMELPTVEQNSFSANKEGVLIPSNLQDVSFLHDAINVKTTEQA